MKRSSAASLVAVSLLACSANDGRFDDFFSPEPILERDAGAPSQGAKPDGGLPDRDAASEGAHAMDAPGDSSDRAIMPEATIETPDAFDPPVVRDAGVDAAPDPGRPLHGQRWEVKCQGGPLPSDTRLCSSMASDLKACPANHRPSDKHVTFGGRPGTHYSVTLRLRGVVETKAYSGGTAVGAHFQIGGDSPPDVVNAFALAVSSPAQTYYVNADHSGGGQVVATLDDTVTIPIDAGATLELYATDTDCIQLRNCVDPTAAVCTPYVVPAVAPAPRAFDGQFAEVDVVSVVERAQNVRRTEGAERSAGPW
jgi:hypothetical protein